MEGSMVKVALDEGAYMPERAHVTDAGADIRTPYGFVIDAKSSVVVRTGVHIETPPNCVTMVKSKSGLNTKFGIVSEGVVDEGFTGEILVKLYNHGNDVVCFDKGDKITQLVIMPVLYPGFEEVEEISGGERGNDGYGSTGR